jgi:hypothetical protein
MKNSRIFIMLAVLVLASLACQALSGGGGNGLPANPSGDEAPPSSSDEPVEEEPLPADSTGDSEFPMTADAYQVVNIGDGSVLYYTKLSLEDVMKFYRDEYTAKGYTERELLTVVSDGVFSMVFDGDPSGKAIVIQSVDLGDGSRTVAIRLEDV